MEYPDLNEEKKLWRKGCKLVVGLDEAGRGPLAGPVFAGAVAILNPKFKKENSGLRINDSKKLSVKQRDGLYKILISHPQIVWGIGRVSEKVIDRINILEATKLAMVKAVKDLEKKLKKKKIDSLLIDGNFVINSKIPQKSIIKGDQKVLSIAAASIIAKVSRDRLMDSFHKKYPEYGFDIHKGYPTALHRQKIKEYGFCCIHRRSFRCA